MRERFMLKFYPYLSNIILISELIGLCHWLGITQRDIRESHLGAFIFAICEGPHRGSQNHQNAGGQGWTLSGHLASKVADFVVFFNLERTLADKVVVPLR